MNLDFLKDFLLYRSRLAVTTLFLLTIGILSNQMGCSSIFSSDSESPVQTYEYDFNERPNDWTAMFSNYTVGREDDFELESGYRTLPEPLDTNKSGFYLSGKNISDDLNMFLKHKINDLDPVTTYEVEFEVSLATNAPSGCGGVGGAPGEGVTVHTAASDNEPERVIDDSGENGYYRLNLVEDYNGNEPNWYRTTEIGNVANSRDCEEGRQYEIKQLSSGRQVVTTDEEGSVWLLVGTRSGYEATTSLYYTELTVRFY